MSRAGLDRLLRAGLLRTGVAALLACALHAAPTRAEQVVCRTDARAVAAALEQIRHAVDPCGESAQILAVLERLDRCPEHPYQVCVSKDAERNVFDRAADNGRESFGTITWNPQLRSEIEEAVDADPASVVRRDPTASLLHELVHAAQECDGLNPGEHELEAVRIENIYRRAAGLGQRSRYGDTRLPVRMVKLCRSGNCSCEMPHTPSRPLPGSEAAAADLGEAASRRSGDRPE